MAGQDFILDVALARNREIAGVFAGDPAEAHRRGVEFVSRSMLHVLEEPADAVITSSAGYPLDLTFYQAIKGVTAALHIVKPGGRILLIAACTEGCGAPEFSRMVAESSSRAAFMDRIAAAPVVVDQWQLEKLGLVAQQADMLYYVPGLPREYHSSLWGSSYPTAYGAVSALTSGLPRDATIAVLPDGPYVLARVAESAIISA
jgi:nickel-dependent lactate racemase